MDNQEIRVDIMTDKQEMRFSINQIEHMTPNELANVLDTVSIILRRLPDETFAELKKQDKEIPIDPKASIQLNSATVLKKLKATEHNIGGLRLILGGLMAISLIIVHDFIAMGQLDLPAFISVLSFALAVPLMAGLLLISFRETTLGYFGYSRSISAFCYVSVFTDILGIDAAFWHISWIAGVVFAISGFVILIVGANYLEKNKLNPPNNIEEFKP